MKWTKLGMVALSIALGLAPMAFADEAASGVDTEALDRIEPIASLDMPVACVVELGMYITDLDAFGVDDGDILHFLDRIVSRAMPSGPQVRLIGSGPHDCTTAYHCLRSYSPARLVLTEECCHSSDPNYCHGRAWVVGTCS